MFLATGGCGFSLTTGCDRSGPSTTETPPADANPGLSREKPAELLVFRNDIRVPDSSVNDFVTRAMRVCAGGDYEQFRLLWSVRDEPLSRPEYERGWQAVQQIKLRALQPIKLARETSVGVEEFEPAYAVLADVAFDPTQNLGKREPLGEVILLVVREQDEWHLTRAPEAVRSWLKDRTDGQGAEADGAATYPSRPTPE